MQPLFVASLIVALQAPALPPGARAASDPPLAPVTDAAPAMPPWINEAIALGRAKKLPNTTLWRSKSLGTYMVYIADYSTPFLRVAAAAREAHAAYREFTPADVTPEMLAPELHIYARPQIVGPDTIDVRAVVITPRKGKDDEKRAAALQPLRFEEIPVVFRNLLGAAFPASGRMAVFPLSALSPESEVHVVYDRNVPGRRNGDGSPDFNFSCSDCEAKLEIPKTGLR